MRGSPENVRLWRRAAAGVTAGAALWAVGTVCVALAPGAWTAVAWANTDSTATGPAAPAAPESGSSATPPAAETRTDSTQSSTPPESSSGVSSTREGTGSTTTTVRTAKPRSTAKKSPASATKRPVTAATTRTASPVKTPAVTPTSAAKPAAPKTAAPAQTSARPGTTPAAKPAAGAPAPGTKLASSAPRVVMVTPTAAGGGAAKVPAKVAPSAPPAQDEHLTYHYNALGRRDPFQPLIGGGFVGMDEGGNAPADVGGIKVVGIVWGATDKFALVEDASGNSAVLRQGDKVTNGFVEGLKRDALIVKLNVDGQTHLVTIPLTRKGEKNNESR